MQLNIKVLLLSRINLRTGVREKKKEKKTREFIKLNGFDSMFYLYIYNIGMPFVHKMK